MWVTLAKWLHQGISGTARLVGVLMVGRGKYLLRVVQGGKNCQQGVRQPGPTDMRCEWWLCHMGQTNRWATVTQITDNFDDDYRSNVSLCHNTQGIESFLPPLIRIICLVCHSKINKQTIKLMNEWNVCIHTHKICQGQTLHFSKLNLLQLYWLWWNVISGV